jgi:hypothetical protein
MALGLTVRAAALACCAVLLWAVQANAQTPNDATPTIVQIDAPTQRQVNALAGLVDIWEVDHTQGVVIAAADDGAIARLRTLGYTVRVDAARSAAAHVAAHPVLAGNADGGLIPGYACYRTVEQTWADMAALATAHPNLAEWVDYGDSWDKATSGGPAGYDLQALRLTNRDRTGPKFPYVVIASIHARELAPAEAAARFAERLVHGYGVDPAITWLLDYGEMTIVPMANPDGRKFAEQLISWRKNTHDEGACSLFPSPYATYGVDLNRNSSFAWGACTASGCSSVDPCDLTYRGAGPASEPETQALQELLAATFADQRGPDIDATAPPNTEGLFISLHSYGELVLYPWGFSSDAPPNVAGLQALGNALGERMGYRVCQGGAPGCLYATDGTNDDWAYGTLGVAAYTIEMGSQFFESCTSFESRVEPVVAKALLYGATAARRPYVWPQGPATLDGSVGLTPAQIKPGDPLTLTATFVAPNAATSAPQTAGAAAIVTGATAWLDAPPWSDAESATIVPFAPADGLFDSAREEAFVVFDTTEWTLGRHILFWSATDSSGEGVPAARFVLVTETPTADPESPEPLAPAQRIFLPFATRGGDRVDGGR